MHLDSQSYVSIAELIVFIPSLLVAILICSCHGFRRSSGWIYTLILCLVRIVGAICQLLTYNNNSTGLLQATIIIDSIGLSPLLFATLGMLSRVIDWINAPSQGFLTIKHFRFLQLFISLGLILSIAGGSSGNTTPDGQIQVSTTSKAAIILYIVAFCGIFLVWLISMSNIALVPAGEKRIAFGVLLALPLIAIRLLYSALVVFHHNHTFSIIDGSVPVHVGMAVVEEFAVVFIYLALGFVLQNIQPEQQGPISTRPWKDRKSQRRNGSRRANSSRDGSRGHSRDNSRNRRHEEGVVYSPDPVHYSQSGPQRQVPQDRYGQSQGYGQV
jgi:hypothetical protein